MGSVIELNECPKCSFEEMSCEYWYRSDEYSELCPKCGYFRKKFLKRDDNREPIMLTEDIRREDVVVLKNNKWVSPEKDEDLSDYPTSNFAVIMSDEIMRYPSFARMDKDGTKVTYPDYITETGGGCGAVHVKYSNNLERIISLGEKGDSERIKKAVYEEDTTKDIVSIEITCP
ncbi:hypothetical protein [Ruminococcus albus]|uniref:Uncharacterized protein n=1 Tax=Ruminococcus albus (strain ATCC 27210 / DSM 20455 / JCM 14654 / NCDO 2250 / 7) TaxID=697329 RepID=E6UK09_RUMA7|nr:hypothetical protein [Ruminococcus albus]ADU24005.1 hypothetical protein Rumal_3564 [Ruminococcus albus 7 = DSM 20455]